MSKQTVTLPELFWPGCRIANGGIAQLLDEQAYLNFFDCLPGRRHGRAERAYQTAS